MVTGEAILGANIFKDFFAGIRDIVGGRSAAYEAELQKAKEIAISEMTERAASLGANAIAVQLPIGHGNDFVGIIDLLIGVRLLQAKQGFSELMRVFAIISLIAGVLEMSVILSPLALILVPVVYILLGLILLREKEEAGFV